MTTPKFKKNLSRIGRNLAVLLAFGIILLPQATVFAGTQCGGDSTHQTTSINLGCVGKGNAITDLTFAIIRFLSNGIGIVVVASMVWAGIQYTASRGDPQATTAAINRIRSNVIALLVYVFAYAMLNFVIPGGFLHG